MARVTVEDCVLKVPNRFELVALAAQRARDISAGSPLTVDRDRDKNPVVALREIAEETISLEEVEESLVQGLQKHVESELGEEDLEAFEGDNFAPDLSETATFERPDDGSAERAAAAENEEDMDLASLARGLAAEAGDFHSKDED